MTVEALRDAGVVVDDGDANTWRVEPSEINAAGRPGRAGPVQRRAVPRRGAGHRRQRAGARLAAAHHPGRRRDPRHLRRDGRRRQPRPRRAHRHRDRASQRARRRPARRRRAHAGRRRASPRWPTRRPGSAASPTCAATRPTGWPPWPTRSTPWAARWRETEDGLRITPAPLHGGLFHTYDDHRMAMAGAVLGLRVPGLVVENVDTTAKTLPRVPASVDRDGVRRGTTARRRGRRMTRRARRLRRERRPGPARTAVGPGRAPRTGPATRTPCPASSSAVDRGRYTLRRAASGGERVVDAR